MSDLGNCLIMSENIKYYMELNNLSRNDICSALDISYSTFADWYHARKYPRIDKIEMLANYFGVQKKDLVERRNADEPELSPGDKMLFNALRGASEEEKLLYAKMIEAMRK